MRAIAGSLLAAALVLGAAGCGGDHSDKKADDNQAATEFGTLKPEDVHASAAEVADGLHQLETYAGEVVSQLGSGDAGETQERLQTIWESVLGTVKSNDAAAYRKIDDALQVLMSAKAADKASAQTAADTVHTTAEDYVTRYPGGSATVAPATPGAGTSSTTGNSGITDSGGGNGY